MSRAKDLIKDLTVNERAIKATPAQDQQLFKQAMSLVDAFDRVTDTHVKQGDRIRKTLAGIRSKMGRGKLKFDMSDYDKLLFTLLEKGTMFIDALDATGDIYDAIPMDSHLRNAFNRLSDE